MNFNFLKYLTHYHRRRDGALVKIKLHFRATLKIILFGFETDAKNIKTLKQNFDFTGKVTSFRKSTSKLLYGNYCCSRV